MSKKSKSSKHKRSVITAPSTAPAHVNEWMEQITHQLMLQDYAGAAANCERLLSFLPQSSPLRADLYEQLGNAYGLLQEFEKSYNAFTQAVKLSPNNPIMWYGRGLASRLTSRIGQSFFDFELASALNTDPILKEEIERELKVSAETAEEAVKLRGPNFTLQQLLEQEKIYTRGLDLLTSHQWDEAIQMFQAAIAMGDCLPQPWFNIAGCFLRQGRYDEAEAALKRSLAIEPDYTIAKTLLAALPEIRRTGLPENLGTYDAFKGTVKHSLKFIVEP